MHHAACDGYDMAQFFLDIEKELNESIKSNTLLKFYQSIEN